MLLNELSKEIIFEGNIENFDGPLGSDPELLSIQLYLEEGKLGSSIKNSAGGFIKGIGSAISKHPFLSGVMAGFATDALKKYTRNKRNTITFYGKSFREKNFYKKMIKDLESSGHYKIVRNQFVDGGQMWQLKRTSRSA